MKNYILYFTVGIMLISCVSYKQNNEYSKDLNSLDEIKFAKKYFTLSNNQNIDFKKIRKNQAYFTFRNNATFQIMIFSDDGYIYDSQLMPLKMLDRPIPRQQLTKSSMFSIEDNILKLESIAASPGDVFSVIDEGIIKNDTIFMKKRYHAKGYKNKRNLFNNYNLIPKIKVFKLENIFFIQSKE